jgi:hypothetical protein
MLANRVVPAWEGSAAKRSDEHGTGEGMVCGCGRKGWTEE